MAVSRVLAFLDTTELSMDSSLRSAKWDSLRRAIADGQLVIAISEVTVAEVARQVAERTEKYNAMLRDHGRQLRTHLPALAPPQYADASTFEADFRARLRSTGVLIVGLPNVSHEALLAREFAGRRPFKRNGTGYRDALIWLSFVEWLRRMATRGDQIFFVSANGTDFAGSSGKPHADLQDDLHSWVSVAVADRLQPVIEASRPPADSLGVDEPVAAANATAAAIAEFGSHRMFALEDLPIEEPYVDAPPFDRGVITALDVLPDDVELTLIDRLDGVQVWDVSTSVRLTVEARVWSWDDARDLPVGWRLLETSEKLGGPYVEGTFDSTWVADVRIDDQGQAIDAALTQVILRLPQPE